MKKLLGKRIKELRTRIGLTQEELAEAIGMGERNLSKIECGINFISSDTLEKITLALRVSPKELFDFEHLKEPYMKKEELLGAINKNEVDVELLYRIYLALKK